MYNLKLVVVLDHVVGQTVDIELRNPAIGSSPSGSATRMEIVVSLHFPAESCKHDECVFYPPFLSCQKEKNLIPFFSELLR